MQSKYFTIQQLMPPEIITKYGDDKCWQFIDEKLITFIDWLKEKTQWDIIINNYANNGNFKYRGFRPNYWNMLEKVKPVKTAEEMTIFLKQNTYCSQHLFGKAVDFDVKGLTASYVRNWLKEHQTDFPVKIWCEDNTNWVHIDVRNSNINTNFILFKP